jgi:hypothetical protein
MSVGLHILEHMFDGALPEPAALAGVDDAVLVGAIAGWARVSAAADARRLAAIADLERRRCDDDDERNLWPCDPVDAAAAEVAAAMNIGHNRAVRELDLGVVLRDRLPQVNTLFKSGAVTAHLVSKIAWRTILVNDDDTVAQVDAEIAELATCWGPLSDYKLIQAVDLVVNQFDPAAVWRTRASARGRSVTIGDPDDSDGTVSFWGKLLASDGSLLDRRLTAMANGVCKDDPRTLDQRRADALGALAAGSFHLACGCDTPGCEAADDDGRASNVVVHIVADQAALQAQPDPMIHGDGSTPAKPEPPVGPEPFVAESRQPAASPTPAEFADRVEPAPALSPPAQAPRPAAGVIPGGGIVPAPLLAELIRNGAKVQFVQQPCAEAEPHYRPSAALAEFVRIRDLTCRYPGCDRPAEFADVDHTIPWPEGLTHPSGLKCNCRKHHLLKTFWTGSGGWSDQQLPDGTVIWTTPAGVTYTTRPGSVLLFPGWNIVTPPPKKPPKSKAAKPSGHDLDTFKRKRTRAQNRERRIQAEREYNAARIAEVGPPPY